jgi:alkylated DNA repair dioxygenase AlkB
MVTAPATSAPEQSLALEPKGDCVARRVSIPGGELTIVPQFVAGADADRLFSDLVENVPWRQPMVRLYGREIPSPRLAAWYADPGVCYRYSGYLNTPLPWTERLRELRARIQDATGHAFNGVLLNLYRNGLDRVGWHSDNESALGIDPVVVSISLGATRRFLMQHKKLKSETVDLSLENGTLLVMGGGTQTNWRHCVPREVKCGDARISLTFRLIHDCVPPG